MKESGNPWRATEELKRAVEVAPDDASVWYELGLLDSDQGRNTEAIADFKKAIAFDPDLKIANQYLQGGYPTIVMIDGNKVVRYVNSGEISPPELQTALNGILSSHS